MAPTEATELIHLFSRLVKIEYGGSGGICAQPTPPEAFSPEGWDLSESSRRPSGVPRGFAGDDGIVSMAFSEPEVDTSAVVRMVSRIVGGGCGRMQERLRHKRNAKCGGICLGVD